MASPQEIAADYLSLMDVEALYLVGSVALGDYRPGISDVDFVAVTEQTEATVRHTHAELAKLHPRPYFDGIYVTWDDLANDPRKTTGIHVHEHTVHTDSPDERHPVTWHTLAQSGVTIHGPTDVDIWTDETALAESVRANLDTYWRKWLTKGVATLTDWGPPWVVLGVTRLHYTLATGKITSKTGAGEYAREAFSQQWHQIIDECLRLRRGGPGPSHYRSRLARRRDTLAYLEHVINDSLA